MKQWKKVLHGIAGFGFLCIATFGCSDSNNDKPPVPPAVETNRIYVATMGNGTLAPVTGSEAEYTLTFENVTENVLWYTDRPERKSGAESVKNYVKRWIEIYGDVAPNAVLDGYLMSGDAIRSGMYLKLREPLYDAETDILAFQTTLLGSSMDDPYHPIDPVNIYDIKLTVFDNTPEGEINYWSFGETAREAVLAPTKTEGMYKLTLKGVYPEVYQVQNAPGTRYEMLRAASLEADWAHYFSVDPPNASLTGLSLTNSGEMRVILLEIDNPSHDGGNAYYDAKVLGGQVLPNGALIDVTLMIDSPEGTYPLCSQSGAEAECYNECFPGGSNPTPLCCPKKNPDRYNCGRTSDADWCKYSLCWDNKNNTCSSDVCTTYKAPSGDLTELIIKNNTKSDVTVYLQAGNAHATDGACPADWAPLQLDQYPCEKVVGEVCEWTLKAGDQTVIPGQPGHCTNGTVAFAKTPSDICGMSLGEFTLNVDPDPTKALTEGVDISLVNGNNGSIKVDLGSSWKVQTTGTFVTEIQNYEGTGANNQNVNGVFNYLCDTCIARVNPPDCPGTETCSTQETCNLLRDGSQQGGTVTFTWNGTKWPTP